MGVLADWQIEAEGVFDPFSSSGQKTEGVISYGASSYGYDVRTAHEFEVFTNSFVKDGMIDPKGFDTRLLEHIDTRLPGKDRVIRNYCVIPPNSFCLSYTMEQVRIPRDCLAIVVGKSTIARCGLIVNVTPLEPSWEGRITMEISNTTPLPAKIYAEEGIAQVVLLRADGVTQAILAAVRRLQGLVASASPSLAALEGERDAQLASLQCRVSYADKKGRYQGQKAQVTLPCVRGQEVKGVGSPLSVPLTKISGA